MKAIKVKSIERKKLFAGSAMKSASKKGISGIMPTKEKAKNVMSACEKDFLSVAPTFDSSDK
jgi:hypothetical protein